MVKNNLENVETVPIDIVGVVFKAREQCNGSVGVAKQDDILPVAAGGIKSPKTIIFKLEEVEKEVENPPSLSSNYFFFLFLSKWS